MSCAQAGVSECTPILCVWCAVCVCACTCARLCTHAHACGGCLLSGCSEGPAFPHTPHFPTRGWRARRAGGPAQGPGCPKSCGKTADEISRVFKHLHTTEGMQTWSRRLVRFTRVAAERAGGRPVRSHPARGPEHTVWQRIRSKAQPPVHVPRKAGRVLGHGRPTGRGRQCVHGEQVARPAEGGACAGTCDPGRPGLHSQPSVLFHRVRCLLGSLTSSETVTKSVPVASPCWEDGPSSEVSADHRRPGCRLHVRGKGQRRDRGGPGPSVSGLQGPEARRTPGLEEQGPVS